MGRGGTSAKMSDFPDGRGKNNTGSIPVRRHIFFSKIFRLKPFRIHYVINY